MTRMPSAAEQAAMTKSESNAELRGEAQWRCMICSGDSTRRFAVSDIWIRACHSCGHQFAEIDRDAHNVQAIYGDDYFSAGGAGYDNYLDESRLLIQRGKRYAALVGKHCRPGSMLDIGAAAGFTLRGFADEGWDVLGIEPNAKMAEYARTKLGVAVEATAIESWPGGHAFDLVTMLQVLPHFADPRSVLQRVASQLRLGGYLLIETWDRKSWAARMFGKSWHEYSPPSVLHWFSRDGLARLLHSEGFALVAQGHPQRWINLGHAKSVLHNKASTSFANRLLLASCHLLPDRLAVPYPGDDLFWMLLRRGNAANLENLCQPGIALAAAGVANR